MSKDPSSSSPQRLCGKIVAFNISPRGHIEGALVETAAGTAQINFPKHDADALARSMRVGSTVDLEVELETDEQEHPVYWARGAEAQFSGTIARLNYALHGEVNGYILEDGTFLHVKPEGAKKYKLHIGDKVKASGSRRSGTDAVVLEAGTVQKVSKNSDEHAHA